MLTVLSDLEKKYELKTNFSNIIIPILNKNFIYK